MRHRNEDLEANSQTEPSYVSPSDQYQASLTDNTVFRDVEESAEEERQPLAAKNSAFLPRETDSTDDISLSSPQQQNEPPHLLLVKVTGYRLLNSFIVIATTVWKAVLSYQKRSIAPTTIELVIAGIMALGCV
jgi:hypothetical protein